MLRRTDPGGRPRRRPDRSRARDGGYGFGRGTAPDGGDTGDGGGGGGAVEATPAGFLDITPAGVRFEAIPDPVTTARAVSTGASALTMLIGAVVTVRRRRHAAGLLARR